MPKKDKMLRIRKNIALPEGQQEYVWNACYRSIKTKDGHYIVPINRCFGDDEYSPCQYLCIWKSPSLNAKGRPVLHCLKPIPQPS